MAFSYPDWMVEGAKVLFDRDMAEILERAIYNGLYFSILEESMEGLMMPVDTLLADEQRLTDILEVIQFDDSLAAKAKSTSDVMVVTVRPPQKGEIQTSLFYAKAEYEERIANYPGLKSAIDMQMKNQLVERKNLELTRGIVENKTNQVDAAATGHLSYTDLLAIHADMADRGYVPTHFLTTHKLMSDLLRDDKLHSTYNKLAIDKRLNEAYTTVWEVKGMGWTIISTRWMLHSEVAGDNLCVGWNKNAYVQQAVREAPQARQYDRGDTGQVFLQGTIWWEEYGSGKFPASGDDAVSFVDVSP